MAGKLWKSIFAVGMICCDGEGHLNEKSILLQSSVEHSGGQHVRLELQKLSQFSVFPGQVVGIEGHNPSGHCLIASKLVDSIPLSTAADVNLHPAKKQALDQEIQSTDLSHKREELSVKSIFAVGMICCDGEGHLNEKSILLQSSVEHSGGQRVRLELQKLSQFSVFPGQVVGIEGHNPSGHCLIASKLVDSIPLSTAADVNLHPAKKQALDQEIQSTDLSHKREELSVIIASGPFTTTDNLSFEPLTELLTYATRKLPQVLILLGPFVDSEHPEIKKGTTDRSFDEIFHVEILRRLQDHVEYMGSNARVILVPSIRDANHDFVFPQPAFEIHSPNLKHQITSLTNPGTFEANQPAFEIHSPNLKHQITSLTNPGTFEANQVKIGCCTVDILKHLSGEEMSRNPADGTPIDRMSRLANHILSQRRFYPLYPPAEGIPLDFSLAPESLHISSIPDILILPSDMKYFVKVLSLGEGGEGGEQVKCICVNPGRLAKGEGGGTFAELNYYGGPDTSNASIIGI
ncbi:dna polymerase alpha subunit b [Quercus suber]|uniref:DNA polymerase alpha subunit B n=1 Tax=Quercus suber TaxID=58331 RepID=A0AAW0LGW8_QUESU